MVTSTRGRYAVSTRGFLRTGIAAYRGPAALIKELMQNADDAPAERMDFVVGYDRLIVRNSGVFTPNDFDNIVVIAAGGKRDEADVTGTWGTGFTSVFQITDHPEIRSSGTRILLDPLTEEYERGVDPSATTGTEFVFPWRLRDSPLSEDIGAEPWSRARIDEFLALLTRECGHNLLFLRHLREVAVIDVREPRHTIGNRVTKQRHDLPGGNEHRHLERFTIESHKGETRTQDWIVFGRSAGTDKYRTVNGTRKKYKNGYVQIAFNPADSASDCAGVLYNMLPTPIDTGFRFHVNGDFFPTADRTSIVTSDDEMGVWNRLLIKSLATLISGNLPMIRDRAGTPETFYRLLPVAHSPAHPFLAPIVEEVRETARRGQYAWTYGGWAVPKTARTPATPAIAEIVAPGSTDIPRITPPGLPENVQTFLDIPPYALIDLAHDIKDKQLAKNGIRLDNASPILNSRERLGRLLRTFDRGIDGGQDSRLRGAVEGLYLALDDNGLLRRLGDAPPCPALAQDTLRALLPAGSVPLVDRDFQRDHRRLLEKFLRTLHIRDVVDAWRTAGTTWIGQPINQSTRSFPSWDSMRGLWRLLAQTSDELTERDLRNALILVDANGIIQPAGVRDDALVVTSPDAEALLAPGGQRFLHHDLGKEPTYDTLRRLAGVRHYTPSDLVAQLRDWCPKPAHISAAHPAVSSAAKIRAWFAFFTAHRAALSQADLESLRTIPFILTQSGDLRSAGSGGSNISLPTLVSGRFDRALLDSDPHKDFLVDPEIIEPDSLSFISGALLIKQISLRRWLGHHIADRFSSLPVDYRLELLRMYRDEAIIAGADQAEFLNQIHSIPLIPCTDGVFRHPRNTFHPASQLNDVFPRGWTQPARDQLPGRTDDIERAKWDEFFKLLQLPDRPDAATLLAEVKTLALSDPADSVNRNQAMAIYTLLDDPWTNGYGRFAETLRPLRDLAWLPSRNRPGWFRPADLVPATYLDRVESQVPVIEVRGRPASAEYSTFLGMPTRASTATILAHLAHHGRTGSTQDPSRIYGYLEASGRLPGDHAEFARMADEPVIYNGATRRWYRPAHTYLDDVSDLFGDRRLSLPNQSAHLALFQAMGVKNAIEPVRDAIDLLREIAAEQPDDDDRSNPLSAPDRNAILRAHRLLIQETIGWDDQRLITALAPLIGVRCVVDTWDRLRRAEAVTIADLPSAAECFPGVEFFDALIDSNLGIDHERLLVALGVVRLSDAVERSIVDAHGSERDASWNARIARLDPHLRRIALGDRDRRSIVDWSSIEVRRVSHLTIRYVLHRGGTTEKGTTVETSAFYSHPDKTLFLVRSASPHDDIPPVAQELAQVIDQQHPQNVSTTLESVLRLALDRKEGEIRAYLDRHRFPTDTGISIDTAVNAVEREAGITVITQSPDIEPDDPAPPASPAQFNGAESPRTKSVWDGVDAATKLVISKLEQIPHAADQDPVLPERAQAPEPHKQTTRVSAGEQSVPDPDGETSGPVQSEADVVLPALSAADQAPHRPEPAVSSERVPFVGNIEPATPRIPTDYARLRERFPDAWAKRGTTNGHRPDAHLPDEQAVLLEHEDFAAVEPSDDGAEPDEATPRFTAPSTSGAEVREARFILSGTGLAQGFLSLSAHASKLFAREGDAVQVTTDDDRTFPLMIDRTLGIAYNQDELPPWFADEEIPAGAKLAIERLSAGQYRLRALPFAPRLIDGLCLLEIEAGKPKVVTGVCRTVHWQIDEAVYRAEIRLEDQAALFAHTAGKGSVFEILVDLLAGSEKPLAETWLRDTVFQLRQVSAATVPWTLRSYRCFVPVAGGLWRLDQDRIFDVMDAEQRQPVNGTSQPEQIDRVLAITPSGEIRPRSTCTAPSSAETWSPVATEAGVASREGIPPASGVDLPVLANLGSDAPDDDILAALNAVRPLVREAHRLERILSERRRARRLIPSEGAEQQPRSRAETIADLIDSLIAERGDDAVYDADFTALLTELLQEWESDPAVARQVEHRVSALDAEAWDDVVRPALDGAIDRFAREGRFVPARELLALDQRLSGRDRSSEFARLEERELARASIETTEHYDSIDAEAADLREALRLDPDLELAHRRLAVLARQAAESAARQAAALLRANDVAAALYEVASARQRVTAWIPHGDAPGHNEPSLFEVAERVIAAATRQAIQQDIPIRARFAATTTALVALREELPAMRTRVPEMRKQEIAALAALGEILGKGGSNDDALVVDLLGARLAASFAGDTHGIPQATDWQLRIAAHAERLGLWDVATVARRKRRDLAPRSQLDQWDRQHRTILRRFYLEQESLPDRYAVVKSHLRDLPATDRVLRSIGDVFRAELLAADSWDRFVP
ncbi:MAG: hypothetical protein M3R02_16120 [Chloroflexota bacterium]|nr:hypothetical protein [Chloroflexota bacterium]